jgi:preprotein translocase subunit SecF
MNPIRTKLTFFTVLVILSISLTFTQSTNAQSQSKGSIENQFQSVIENSSRYQDFKVVKEVSLNALRANVLDTLKKLRATLNNSNNTITAHQANMDSVRAQLKSTNDRLDNTFKEKNSIRFLGMLMSKEAYSRTMWIIIGILAVVLIVFIILFKRSNKITVQNKQDLQETRDEFEKFRKRALLREQELSRNHLAELNKYKKQAGS